MCLYWFVSCVHLHNVITVHFAVMDYFFVYIGDPKGLQDHDSLGKGHLQKCAVCTPGRQWEKVQTCVTPMIYLIGLHNIYSDASNSNVCVDCEYIFVCWKKSWTGHCCSRVHRPCSLCVPVLPSLEACQVCGDTSRQRRSGEHWHMWQRRRGMQRRVGKGPTGCVCVLLLVVMATCVYVRIILCIQKWAVVHRYVTQKSTVPHNCLTERGMPISLCSSIPSASIHCFLHCSSVQQSSIHPSFYTRSLLIAGSGSDRKGGVVGKALRWLTVPTASRNNVSLAGRIHYAPWRGKHRSFPVG